MLKETATAVGAALMFSPLGMPVLVHGLAGLLVGTAGMHIVNGVINDVKGAGDALKRDRVQPGTREEDDQE